MEHGSAIAFQCKTLNALLDVVPHLRKTPCNQFPLPFRILVLVSLFDVEMEEIMCLKLIFDSRAQIIQIVPQITASGVLSLGLP